MILKLENAGGPDSRRLTYSMIEREIMELFSGPYPTFPGPVGL